LISRLNREGVEYVVIGGVAVNFHGYLYSTRDMHVCAPLHKANVRKLIAALSEIRMRQRSHPHRPPFPADLADMDGLKNLYIETDFGQLDVLGHVEGVGDYSQALTGSVLADFNGEPCRYLDLEALLAAKRAAGRPRDRLAVTQLEAIQKLRAENRPPGHDSGGGA
jgi:hypothetical protein